MNIKGCVERIVFRNEDNGYTVMAVTSEGKSITCVGTLQYIGEGEFLSMEGEIRVHPVYEEQFVFESYEIKAPEDTTAILRYLSSGAIKGVGAKLADRIVMKFGEDTFRIIEEEPERLSEVRGISARLAMDIASQLEEKKDMRKAMMFLQKYGISSALAVKIYTHYGHKLYEVIENNPYKMAEDIQGVGFKIADDIAKKSRISPDSEFRIHSGIVHVLVKAGENGHSCLPIESIKSHAEEILQIQIPDIEHYIMDMVMNKSVVIKERENGKFVYTKSAYLTELSIASMLAQLDISDDYDSAEILDKLDRIEDKLGICLDDIQRNAVLSAVNSGVLVITGGPGTGKTTTINSMINYFEDEGMDILLAAPTGRAAKRMSEATGCEAQTIHRLLGINGNPEDGASGMHFERNEENPLDTDVIIIDEMSMVDMYLMCSLLKAIVTGTKLILVGDVDQLPSVGPGNVLKDIINSQCFRVVKLEKIFRQAGGSGIVTNAHKINLGEDVIIDNKDQDFLIVKRNEANKIIQALCIVVKEKMPKHVDSDVFDIQVLTPMRKGALGVEHLNEVLQQYLNPPDKMKRQLENEHGIYREGDKVMQIKNNYQLDWEVRGKYGITADAGKGVYNGDMGIIKNINTFTETIEVLFDDDRMVEYPFENIHELELAYAITIHKSQGSEYPAVIMPLLTGSRFLMTRNLLYTGVTRAKKCVCIIGTQDAVSDMIANASEQKRYSGLESELRKMCRQEDRFDDME